MPDTLNTFSTIGDPDGTRTITAIVVLLVVLGIALLMLAMWLHKVTRPDPDLLAPLDVMGDRKWRRADPVWQRRRLDEVRPPGARPLQPSVAPPALDEAFERGPAAHGFDDLHEPVHAAHGEPVVGTGDPDGVPQPVESEHEVDAEGEGEAGHEEDETHAVSAANGASTPTGIQRPDELPEGDIDPELLERAMRELEAELAEHRHHEDAEGSA